MSGDVTLFSQRRIVVLWHKKYCKPAVTCFMFQSGLCAATEMESSRGGSIRIQHLTAAATSGSPADGRSRFPKLDECAHFHYEQVELGPFQVRNCFQLTYSCN